MGKIISRWEAIGPVAEKLVDSGHPVLAVVVVTIGRLPMISTGAAVLLLSLLQ